MKNRKTGILCITRKLEESILIGDEIEITILRLGEHQVKLGIKAPKDLKVDREKIRKKRDAIQ